ncbi:hypothetical protein DPEC_G00213410, partial [Dallia pectoralis]
MSLCVCVYLRGSQCLQPGRCRTLVPEHLPCLMGPGEFHECPHEQSKAGKIPHLKVKRNMIIRPDPSSLQRLMVLFPELIQYNSSLSKSMDRPENGREAPLCLDPKQQLNSLMCQ